MYLPDYNGVVSHFYDSFTMSVNTGSRDLFHLMCPTAYFECMFAQMALSVNLVHNSQMTFEAMLIS